MAENGVYRERLDEQVMDGMRLGRHVEHDPRSREYVAELAPQIQSVTHNASGLPLNQGQIGSCTANALCGALDSTPNYAGGSPLNEQEAVNVYELETKLEGHPYPPNDPGGSGLDRVGPVTEGLVIWVVGIGAMMLVILWIGAKS